jgi:hypothetical protein
LPADGKTLPENSGEGKHTSEAAPIKFEMLERLF